MSKGRGEKKNLARMSRKKTLRRIERRKGQIGLSLVFDIKNCKRKRGY